MNKTPSIVEERQEAKRFLIVTDGILTEKTYFERVNRLSRDNIIVKKVKHSKDLVSVAQRMQKDGKFDKTYIVCDIDEHCKNTASKTSFEHMINEARRHNIEFICSHESFEVWLLCHKDKVPSMAKDRKYAQKLAEKQKLLKGNNAKVVVDESINKDSILAAIDEAERLRNTYGNHILDDRPTTDVDKIIKNIDIG